MMVVVFRAVVARIRVLELVPDATPALLSKIRVNTQLDAADGESIPGVDRRRRGLAMRDCNHEDCDKGGRHVRHFRMYHGRSRWHLCPRSTTSRAPRGRF